MSAVVEFREATVGSLRSSVASLFPCGWALNRPLLQAPDSAPFLLPGGSGFLSPTSLDPALAAPLALAPPTPSHSPAFRCLKAGGQSATGLADRRSCREIDFLLPWSLWHRPRSMQDARGWSSESLQLRGVRRCSEAHWAPGPLQSPQKEHGLEHWLGCPPGFSSTLHVTLGSGSYPPTPPSPPPGQDQAAGELAQIGERSNFRSG